MLILWSRHFSIQRPPIATTVGSAQREQISFRPRTISSATIAKLDFCLSLSIYFLYASRYYPLKQGDIKAEYRWLFNQTWILCNFCSANIFYIITDDIIIICLEYVTVIQDLSAVSTNDTRQELSNASRYFCHENVSKKSINGLTRVK